MSIQDYVFKDIATDSGPPWYQEIDIFEELNIFKQKNVFSSDYDFHSNLKTVISKLKDAHLAYLPPKCYHYLFIQPFPIRQLSNGKFEVTKYWKPRFLKLNIPELFATVYPSRRDLYENHHYEGFEVVQINHKDPYTVIKKYADEKCSYSRDPQVRFNRVLSSEWYARSTIRHDIPTESHIFYTLKNHDGRIWNVKAPWIFLPKFNYTKYDTGSFQGKFANLNPMEVCCGYHGHYNPNLETFENASMNSTLIRHGNTDFFGLDRSCNVYEIKRRMEIDSAKKLGIHTGETRSNLYETEEQVPSGFEHIHLPNETLEHRYYRLFVKIDEPEIALLKVITFYPYAEDRNSHPDEGSFDIYVIQLHHSFVEMSKLGIKKVIIDVRGNTGGAICFPIALASYLSPYTPLSPVSQMDRIFTELHNTYFNITVSGVLRRMFSYVEQDRTPAKEDWYSGGPTRKRGKRSSRYSKIYHVNCDSWLMGRFHSHRISLCRKSGKDEDCSIDESTPRMPWLNSPKMFEPEDIQILTDGTCGSACGKFVRLVQNLHLGKVISQGGYFFEREEMERTIMNPVSFPGASVESGSSLQNEAMEGIRVTEWIRNNSQEQKFPDEQKLRKSLYSGEITVSVNELYLWKPQIAAFELEKLDDSVPSGYIVIPADFHLENNWDFSDDIFSDPQLLQLFDVCSDWQIKRAFSETPGFCPPNSLPFEEAVFGYPCRDGEFNENECVLRGCDKGYYLSESGEECLEMPNDDRLHRLGLYYYNRLPNYKLVRVVYVCIFCCIFVCCFFIGTVYFKYVRFRRDLKKRTIARIVVEEENSQSSRSFESSGDSSTTSEDESMSNSTDSSSVSSVETSSTNSSLFQSTDDSVSSTDSSLFLSTDDSD